jgi:ABC-type transport system involved in multi-copper enzyme maturation permease subunit
MFPRILPIARVTFLEALRQRFFGFLLVLALALTLGSLPLKAIDFGNQELKFLADLGFGVMLLLGSVLAVVLPAQLLYAELDNRTALTILAKPVGRAEFLLGKFLGAWAVLAVFAVAVAALLGVILALREPEVAARAARLDLAPPELSLGGLAAHALLQVLRLGVVAAMTLLVGALSRSFLFTVVVGAMAVLAGQLVWVAQEALGRPDQGALLTVALWVSTRFFPNLQSFNLGEALVLAPGTVEAGTVPALLVSGATYLALLLLLAWLAFRRREI